jgi:hypothetical protein
MKEEYKNLLSENEFNNMINDKNFIKGVFFYSNKMEINFK